MDYDVIKFILGDLRVNEQPTLGTMHLVFVREHNRLATNLKSINPDWNDEIIYQVILYMCN